ncbi:MAG: bifunctional pyr operon transcriptional regulator/uracil phosphoribosyltransferase PyrR [Gammaproteobacteria bacterium]|nr:bifunctional pyr operon transcriptional regulator/uracil phosphoribosyltransferase PyrR [Gammaproteobacteria bacterium]NIR28335.1 bifunctional pyr operon transcriptional regulator/uracil phosphoribosyltransferase PyrR [Gammaproteobacteria bacterium]NIR96749.1 bifunctional pyr operon transcriptional regulator/uracil phosphoribosyltransferase PyrR [Gammaproteobacteria bacterium]NIT62451.1 bifunctional pyr operon transcriptional regulator/uracil phosphoribosyltransferase PyrR [Gammaproteobacteri
MAEELKALLEQRRIRVPLMVGIHTGGVWVAERLHALLGLTHDLGILDISFYRDDFSRIGMNPQVKPSKLPYSVDDQHIVLVDDVLYTGRTVRAAMNEIFDYGRPASIVLAVLVDRGGRELPIEASVVGRHLALAAGQHVKLTGPDPLTLVIQDTKR